MRLQIAWPLAAALTLGSTACADMEAMRQHVGRHACDAVSGAYLGRIVGVSSQHALTGSYLVERDGARRHVPAGRTTATADRCPDGNPVPKEGGLFTPMDATLSAGRDLPAQPVKAAFVTADFFNVQPMLGRLFIGEEYVTPDHTQVAILSHALWAERFASSPSVIGSTVVVSGRQTVVVGVAPARFAPAGAGALWLPMVK